MKRFAPIVLTILLAACIQRSYEQNPDPNHTHADFSVWFDGEKVDFSGPEYMSGIPSDEADHHKHLHMHDEIGDVLHRHKPGLSLQEFFDSLQYDFAADKTWLMFVNGEEMEFDLSYVFKDMDAVLLTTSAGSAEVLHQVELLTDDACLYSKTCPWRGDPPAENCIADPAVPCVAPLD
ncbi:MAG: hypothetical protein O2904_02605 [bacterium]|nr:hypothetical protein [bacterium]